MPLRTNNPDVVVVGAGIAGAPIATVLARRGVEVLLLERQRGYRDRVRGEYMAPWGVLEARALGLGDQAAHCADHDRAVRGQPRQPVLHSVRGLHPGQGSARRGAPASA
jgi:2-polyprenyl-6-methoxyphenol hydroxylase-like FAD-dependent oxidoreductase